MGVKKLFILAILIGAIISVIGFDRIKNWLSHSQVLGEKITPVINGAMFKPAQEIIGQNIRWPQKKDFQLSSQAVLGEEDQAVSPKDSEDFNRSLESLTEEIKNLPQQQLVKVKEQLIKEIFPDCQCDCQ
ncbi:MAG: hypothetical protein PHX72_01930 [Candidatus Shapirobacteria bacterium]|nr:hypothetical protein [Candidatus Shapirobacteria bacterium]